MSRRPTMVDVARHAGVSLKTVSRVVNSEPNVAAELIARVEKAVAELGFQRNSLASSLRRSGQQTATIGLLIEEIANPFYATIAAVAADVARAHNSLLITASSEEDPVREEQLLRDLRERRVDGLLVVPAGADHAFLQEEVVVFLDRPGTNIAADTVLLDNRGGARAGVEHLRAQGHEHIAVLLDSVNVYTMRERLAGVLEAAPAVTIVEGVHDPDTAAAAVRREAGGHTAFLALNNRITVGVVQELWRSQLTKAVMGFDDFELAHLMPMPLTLIAYDTRDFAKKAAEMLFERINGYSAAARTTILHTSLVQKGLT